MAAPTTLSIVNRSTTVTDGELAPAVAAIQRQLDEHLTPAWWGAVQLSTTQPDAAPPDGAWRVLLVDSYDAAPTLAGQHQFAGVPSGFVDIGRAAKARVSNRRVVAPSLMSKRTAGRQRARALSAGLPTTMVGRRPAWRESSTSSSCWGP